MDAELPVLALANVFCVGGKGVPDGEVAAPVPEKLWMSGTSFELRIESMVPSSENTT